MSDDKTAAATPSRSVAQFLRGIDLSHIHLTYPPIVYSNATSAAILDGESSEPSKKTDAPDSQSAFALPPTPDKVANFEWCQDLMRLQWLKLDDTGLTEVPAEVQKLPHLERLTLTRCALARLRPGLAQLQKLRVLNCRKNKLTDSGIPAKLFNNQELQVFDASYNCLTMVPPTLPQARSLLVLNLSHNQLTTLPTELFTECSELLFLDVSHNRLVEIPPQLRRLSKLQQLHLSYNPLRHAQLRALTGLRDLRVLHLAATERRSDSCLPSEFGDKMGKLMELDLADNGLTRLPDSVYQLKSLVKLDLSFNEVSDLSGMVDSWPNLTYLNVSFNNLASLPAALCRLVQLRKLYVNNNQLTFSGMPAGLGKLQDLTVFNASDNKLENIPEGLCRCGRLKRLLLNNNCLVTLPDAIHYLIETLDAFEISGNPQLVLPKKPAELQHGAGLAYYNIDFSLENMLRQAAGAKAPPPRQDSSQSKDAGARIRRMMRSRHSHLAHRNSSCDDSDTNSQVVLEGMRRVARDKQQNPRRERGGPGDTEGEMQHEKDSTPLWKQKLVRPDLDYSQIFGADVGQQVGLDIWEIDEFYPKLLEQEALKNTFYDGDCYILLHTFSTTPPNGVHRPEHDQLQWAIFYWIGRNATLDKRACAAMHAVNLRNLLGAECRTVREEHGDESEEFLRLVGRIHVIEGAHGETGFMRVEQQELPTKLYRLYPDGPRMGVFSMPVCQASLDPKFTYVLDSPCGVFVWVGLESRTVAQTKARVFADKLLSIRRKSKQFPSGFANGKEDAANNNVNDPNSPDGLANNEMDIRIVVQLRESKSFWTALLKASASRDGAVSSADVEVSEEDIMAVAQLPVKDHIPADWIPPPPLVYDVVLGKGYLELPQISLASTGHMEKKLLQTKNVYIVRSGGEVFVWCGRKSAKFLRFAGIKLASECMEMVNLDAQLASTAEVPNKEVYPIVCKEGVEPPLFKYQFRGWDDALAVDFTRTAESVRKRGVDLNSILEKDKMKVDLKHIFVPRDTPPSSEEAVQLIQDSNLSLVKYDDLCESEEDTPTPGSVKTVLTQLILHGGKWSSVENRWLGHFFSQDCYLILAEYWDYANEEEGSAEDNGAATEDGGSGGEARVQTVIYFWQGRDASDVCLHQFNLSLRKDLVDSLVQKDGRTVAVRVFHQQQEEQTFLAHYERAFTIHYGRYEDRYVGDVGQSVPASGSVAARGVEMFVLRSQGGCLLNTRCIQVAPSTQQLNSHFHCIVRVPLPETQGDRVYVWIGGSYEGPQEDVDLVHRVAREIYDGRNKSTFLTVHEGEEDVLFWHALGGKKPYDRTVDYLYLSRLFRLSNEQGFFTASEKCYDFCQDDLADDDVMMLDTGEQIYLWIGANPSDVEKKLAPQAAKVYREHLARTQPQRPRQMRYTLKGQEPHLFKRCFHGWGKFRQHLK